MSTCKLIAGQAPYTTEGCANMTMFAVNTHLNGMKDTDTIADIAYRKELSNYVLNCGEGAGSYSNIMKLFPSKKVPVKSKEYYQRYMNDVNINVYAAAAVSSLAGATATLTLNQKSYLNNGTASMLANSATLVNQRNSQVYQVEGSPNTAVAWNHSAVIRAYSNEAIDIRPGDALAVFNVRIIGDVACSTVPSVTWRDMGYASFSSPMRFEASWCMEHGLAIQNQVYQLDLMDNTGKRFKTIDPVVRSNKRREVEMYRTLLFLFGTRITNPNITTQGNFKGWNGLLYSIRYGGGNYQPIPMSGITVVQLDQIETRGVQMGIKEWVWYLPHEQRNNLETNLNLLFSASAGSCNFDTFRRSGGTDEERNGGLVTQLGVTSLKRNGMTHHFMTASWATETNGLGHGILKDAIFVLPSVGSKDINGNTVPTFEDLEFDESLGQNHYKYEETIDDMSKRGPDFCEKTMGVIRDTMWKKINCLNNFWQFQPSSNC